MLTKGRWWWHCRCNRSVFSSQEQTYTLSNFHALPCLLGQSKDLASIWPGYHRCLKTFQIHMIFDLVLNVDISMSMSDTYATSSPALHPRLFFGNVPSGWDHKNEYLRFWLICSHRYAIQLWVAPSPCHTLLYQHYILKQAISWYGVTGWHYIHAQFAPIWKQSVWCHSSLPNLRWELCTNVQSMSSNICRNINIP